jgi:protein transport protein SEC24
MALLVVPLTKALNVQVAFRTGLSTKLDDRVFAMCELKTMPTQALISSIYPDLYPIHALTETGALNANDEVSSYHYDTCAFVCVFVAGTASTWA